MHSFAATLADVVFPRICCGCFNRVMEPKQLVCAVCLDSMERLEDPICSTCGEPGVHDPSNPICPDCPNGSIYFEKARGFTQFRGIAKTLVEKLKYSGRVEYAPVMAPYINSVIEAEYRGVVFDAVVPVPLFKTRERERGFNQAAMLGREVCKGKGLVSLDKVVMRTRGTSTQTRLTRAQRARNIKDAFAIRRPAEVDGKTLLLIDDVYTTGATTNECARVLREAGAAAVYVASFARATDR